MDHTAPLGNEIPASHRELGKKGGLLKRLSRSMSGDGDEQVPDYLQMYGTARGLATADAASVPALPWLDDQFSAASIAVARGAVAGTQATIALGSRTGGWQRWM